jgi:glucokinase
MGLAIGVDIGGTKVAAGVVDADGRVLARLRRDTPAPGPRQGRGRRRRLHPRAGHRARGRGGRAGGGWVRGCRPLHHALLAQPGLAQRAAAGRGRQRTGLPVVVENDANAAAWAETRFGTGHGQPYTVTVTITVGTGLGGGVVLGGELLRGAFGAAAEVGHMNLVPDGRPCGCGNAGCWEQYASGRALVTEARQRAARSPRLGRPAARVRQRAGRCHHRADGDDERGR